jgi:hypothetical protein
LVWAQAHGARIHGQSVGSFGDVAAWDFCQDKILTTAGEVGMVTTSRTELWDAMWAFKDHGKTHEAVFGRENPPCFRWLHERFGSNFRFTELQSAIGRIQLQPDPPPPPSPSERGKLVRDALRVVFWRATGSTGGWLGPEILALKRADCGV